MSRTQVNVLTFTTWIFGGLAAWYAGYMTENLLVVVPIAVIAFVGGFSPQIAKEWERAIVLHLGKFAGVRGPGVFLYCRLSIG